MQRCYTCGRETPLGQPLGHFVGCEVSPKEPIMSDENKDCMQVVDYGGVLEIVAKYVGRTSNIYRYIHDDLLALAEAQSDPETEADNAKAADRACLAMIAQGYYWNSEAWARNEPSSAPVGVEGFGLAGGDIAALLAGSLKPEEIGGDATTQHERVGELLRWFVRLTDQSANPKWTVSHACELAYYIATTAGNRHIDTGAIRKAAFGEGVNLPLGERALLERLGLAIPLAQQPAPVAPVGVGAAVEHLKDRTFPNHECPAESAAVWNTALYEMQCSLAQQPTAVDEATVRRVAVAINARYAGSDNPQLAWKALGSNERKHKDAVARAAITALAQQPAAPNISSAHSAAGSAHLQPAAVDTWQSCDCGFEDPAGGYEACPECGKSLAQPQGEK